MSTSRLLPAAALALALLGGCGLPVPGTAAPAAASAAADPATWVDGFCGAIVRFQEATQTEPTIDSSSPKKAIAGLRTYFDGLLTSLDKANADLKNLGPAPAPVGDAAVATITGYLTSVRASFAQARSAVLAADTNDPQSILAAMQSLQTMPTPPDTLKDFTSDPALDAAAAQSPNCKKLEKS